MTTEKERAAAIAAVADSVRDDGEPASLMVCVGPPECVLQDADADIAQAAGCRHCDRFTVGRDGVLTRVCDA